MKEERVETLEGVFYVKALSWGEVRKVLKDAGVTKVRMIGGDMPSWELDVTDIVHYMLLAAARTENGPLSIEKLDSLSPDTVSLLINKALELTPIFRILSTG
ncbi:MAG: hypothetical protein QXN77_08015 [Candidatus Caldarchaeum sp.]